MNKMNDTAQTPHCGWIYVVPETKTPLEAPNFTALVDKAMENYEINNIKIERSLVSDQIEDYICTRIPSGLCKGFVNHFVMTPTQLINGTKNLTRIVINGKDTYVDQDKAEGRALICSNCPGNANIKGGCKGHGIPEMIKRLRRGRSTPLDDKLHVCVYCKCFLVLLVHINAAILDKVMKKPGLTYYPDHCWKKREIEKLRRQP